ncbi:diaminopimelate epimerase [Pseudomonas abieticivorans]|uniref:diaminopimelate epimerase n=1 Tax=Pseudomonas abieticivorans TaxID=2931382 RepID=UPI0020BF5F82|nr:diaminopimelate epimerase [Pseudomonas sp. PIA16]
MPTLYDARGNLYAVASPDHLRQLGIDLPATPQAAAQHREQWAMAAIEAICAWPAGTRPAGAKGHRSDGLLVGPFEQQAPFDLLIVNTDGSLAERSGNGLTIFSQALTDSGVVGTAPFALRVHHDQAGALAPVQVDPATVDGVQGFWLELGTPGFGPLAVGAEGFAQTPLPVTVAPLQALDPAWHTSQFVRIGNPHCVTLLAAPEQLPSMAQLRAPVLGAALTRIAYARDNGQGSGEPCPAGVNLQWAALTGVQRVMARVFERGEGPTESSGTSASAVASAAWQAGWVTAGQVEVLMPGGTAPLRLTETGGQLAQVSLFGTARPIG